MNKLPRVLNLILRLRKHLSPRRQKEFIGLLFLMIISSCADVVSLGAVLPFLGVLMAPERVLHNHLLIPILHFFNIALAQQLITPLTLFFVISILIAGSIRTYYAWVSNRLIFICGADLSIEIYKRTLYQPYKVHVSRNSSVIINGITTKVNTVMYRILNPALMLFSAGILMVSLLAFLFSINAKLALGVFLSFGISYTLIAKLLQLKLKQNSIKIAKEETDVLKALQEGLGGIRDVLLDNSQQIYCDIYHKADLQFRRAQGVNLFISQSPRFLMESLTMILIAGVSLVLSQQKAGLVAYIPILGILAISSQRILPALQQVYSSWANIVSSHASLADIITLLDQPIAEEHYLAVEPLPFLNSIQFVNAKFRYHEGEPWVLDGINLIIPRGARVGVIGSTGCGKSTTIDILMGLLYLNEGQLLIDNQRLDAAGIKAWQRNIAHVPQSIFLADTTFAENIAFGVARDLIDMNRVKRVAAQAQIADFIERRPKGYDDTVGERGVRLSGGQRQRIGIARALYKEAHVLVFDEATSALDNSTEQAVMDAIDSLNKEFTIILIAHRLNTVKHCDLIIELNRGCVVAEGSYEEIINKIN